MNEITKIHLGRQAFTIAVDAHKALQDYLHAIKRQVGEKGKEVVKEVELRMAELLAERGVTGDKVVLLEDVEYLKEQLGAPKDFTEAEEDTPDDEEKSEKTDKTTDDQGTKRLFRDTERGMIAGVAAGLAAYLRIDPVFVRIGFILLTIAWGWGILAYIILWLIIPEAKSSSNRLQMQGKAVTVANIKESVNAADVPGATRRAGRTFGRFLERLGSVLLTIFGFVFVLAGAAMLIGTMTTSVYWLLNGGQVNNAVIFPVGADEIWLLLCGMTVAIIFSILTLLIGMAMMRRKWPVPGWVLATMIGLFLVAGSVGTALGFHVAPSIADRVEALRRTKTVMVSDFTSVNLKGHDTQFAFVPSDTYSVKLSYVSADEKSDRMVTRADGKNLTVDVTAFARDEECRFICLYNDHNVKVTVYAPSLEHVTLEGTDSSFESLEKLRQEDMTVVLDLNSYAQIGYAYPEKVFVDETKTPSAREIKLIGIRHGEFRDQSVDVGEDFVSVNRTDAFELKTTRVCEESEPLVYLQQGSLPVDLTINGTSGLHAPGALESRQEIDGVNSYNCVMVAPL